MARTLVGRVRGLFAGTAMAWKCIATERVSVGGVFRRHVLPLAILSFGMALLGWGLATVAGHAGFVPALPMAIGHGLAMLAMAVLGIWLLAQAVDLLAPRFAARRSELRAFKLMAYGATPLFLTGFFALVPGAVWFCLMGLGAALWLIWHGLPRLMRCPPEKHLPYFVAVALGVLLWALLTIALIHAMQPRVPSMPQAAESAEAGNLLPGEAASAPGDNSASAADAVAPATPAASEALALPPIAGAPVPGADPAASAAQPADAALPPASVAALGDAALQRLAQQLGAAVPASLAGMARDAVSVQPLSLPGASGVAVNAGFGQGERRIFLNLVYVGPDPRQTVLGDWANATVQRDDGERTERVHAEGARHVSEVARKDGSGASLRMLLANGVMLDADAEGMALEPLKAAIDTLPLAGIERLQPGA